MKYLLLSVIFFGLIGCRDDITYKDNISPERPKMISHLGDCGDPNSNLTDSNNGTDAVAGIINAIKIVWNPLMDNDLDYIDVFRFNQISNDVVKIDSIGVIYETPPEYYIDNFESFSENPIGLEWFYYISVYDQAGNCAISDTVSYTLIEKSYPLEPHMEQIFSKNDTIRFIWNRGGNIQHCRILVFREDHSLYWQPREDWYYINNEETEIVYTGNFMPGRYLWRVDSFDVDNSGSESQEITFYMK